MATLAERLVQLRKARGLNQRELAQALCVSPGAVGLWETGSRFPSPELLEKIADYFGVTIDYLLGRSDIPDGVDGLCGAIPVGETVRVPVLGVIRAGEPIYADEHIEGYEEIPKEWCNREECFFLRVTGDSMIGARIQEGDLVFVRRQDYAENGDIVVAIINGQDATIKRIFFTRDAVILHPENPKYKPIILQGREREELRIIGKVLWFKGTVT